MSSLRPVVSVAILCLSGTALGEERGLLLNPGFEEELTGWVFRPGDESQVSLADAGVDRGTVLELHPGGKLLGVETERLAFGRELSPDQAYRVEAQLKHAGLDQGVFAFSMYCFDAQGKSLRQIAFYGLSTRSAAHDWRKVQGTFGPGSRNPLPEGTESVCIRFSFYEAGGDCRGTVAVDDVILQPYDPPQHEGWPTEIVAQVGLLEVRFESRSFWTLYRIDYRGTRLCLDRWGSHYGSVVSFPGVGFIGSGHTENEEEQLLDVKLFVDGEPVDEPEPAVRCREIRLERKSRVRDLVLNTEINVEGDRIMETVRMKADKPTPVKLVYHFMHPWTPTATEYYAELLDGTTMEGTFDGDRAQKLDRAVRWSAIYDGPSGKGAITCVLDAPADDDWRTRYWDVPDRYRKHYLATFLGRTVPADQEFCYRVVTVPFEATHQQWKKEAARVAATCKPPAKPE